MLSTYVRTVLGSNIGLNSEGITIDRIFLTHGLDTPQERPMIVMRWLNTSPGMGPVNRRLLQVWIHDEPGDYDRIDRCLQHVRDAFDELVGMYTGTAGKWLSQVDWQGNSDNLDDDEVGTFVRYGEYMLTGSAA